MADKKISQLTDLPAASVSPSNDVLAIVDTNVTETKKITAKALVDGALNAGTANGLVYLNGSKEATTGSIITYDGTTFKVDDAVVINESGGDNDTRIEGDTDANLFFVDASTDRVGIGTSSPSNKLTVSGNADVTGNLGIGTASPSSFSGYTTVSVNNATNGGIYNILVNGTETARLQAFSGAFTVAAKGAATNLLFETNGSERARIDPSGNLGLGVTPSAWNTAGRAIEVGKLGNAVYSTAANTRYDTSNAFLNSVGDWKYAANGNATLYTQFNGTHAWSTAASGTAGNTITFTQAMTLDASGNLLVGATSNSEGARLKVDNGYVFIKESGGADVYLRSAFAGGIAAIQVASNSALGFATNNTERARITAGGDLLVGTTSTTPNPGVAIFASGGIGQGNSAGASGFEFHSFRRSAVQIGSITQNGTTAVAYNTSSDRRLKENIVPAPDAGAKIDAIEIVSHDWKSTPDEHVEFGVIAQDLALVAPQAVTAGDDGEEIERTWGVDYSKLVPMLVKEIQSLRKRVAELEAK